MSQQQNKSPQATRVAWLFNCIGTPTSLLYWNGILPRYLERFPSSWFFTARPPSQPVPGTNKSVECVGSIKIPLGKRKGSYERQIVVGSPRILRELRRIRPQVVVVQEFLSFAAYLAIFRRMLPGSKLLMLLESDPIRGIPGRKKWWSRLFRKVVAKRFDHFLTNNDAGKQYLLEELGVNESLVMVQPYLVSEIQTPNETQELPTELRADTKDCMVFLYVGQLVERKGIEQLLHAIAALDETQRKQAKFWLIGKGEQAEALKQMSSELGLAPHIRFLGPKPYEELPTYYKSADVFVMPTLDDYRALVGFEALSYGMPLVHSCYDGAVTELVEEGKNGTVADPRDSVQFASRIAWMLEQKNRLAQMSDASKMRWSSGYTLEHAVSNLVDAINRCSGALISD